MREIGVKYIIFSNKDGTLTKMKARDFTPSRISLGRQFIQAGFNPIKREKQNYEDDNLSVSSASSYNSYSCYNTLSATNTTNSKSKSNSKSKKSKKY